MNDQYLQALKAEITNDPDEVGYARMTPDEITRAINSPVKKTREVTRPKPIPVDPDTLETVEEEYFLDAPILRVIKGIPMAPNVVRDSRDVRDATELTANTEVIN